MAGAVGIEPTSAVLETVILPLYYAPKNMLQDNFILKLLKNQEIT